MEDERKDQIEADETTNTTDTADATGAVTGKPLASSGGVFGGGAVGLTPREDPAPIRPPLAGPGGSRLPAELRAPLVMHKPRLPHPELEALPIIVPTTDPQEAVQTYNDGLARELQESRAMRDKLAQCLRAHYAVEIQRGDHSDPTYKDTADIIIRYLLRERAVMALARRMGVSFDGLLDRISSSLTKRGV